MHDGKRDKLKMRCYNNNSNSNNQKDYEININTHTHTHTFYHESKRQQQRTAEKCYCLSGCAVAIGLIIQSAQAIRSDPIEIQFSLKPHRIAHTHCHHQKSNRLIDRFNSIR